jgi:hypothetical protein
MATIDIDPAAFASGGSISTTVRLGDKNICGFIVPAGWTAAPLSILASLDGGTTFFEYYDTKANTSSFTVGAGQYVAVDPTMFRGVNSVQLRSGTAATPVNQAAALSVGIVSRRVM